jgi:hypothetical protein
MAAKRFLISFALAALLATTGCRTWCEHHYPCPGPAYPAATTACVPCVPCCPQTTYAPPPPVAPSANWTQPAAPRYGTCVCP